MNFVASAEAGRGRGKSSMAMLVNVVYGWLRIIEMEMPSPYSYIHVEAVRRPKRIICKINGSAADLMGAKRQTTEITSL